MISTDNKIKVSIEKNWGNQCMTDAEFLSQAPPDPRFEFRIGYQPDCDYLIILNRPRRDIATHLPPDRIWGIIQEPPNEIYAPLHRGQRAMGRIYNQRHGSERSGRHRPAPPFVPWFVRSSWLEACERTFPEKPEQVSCISSKTHFFRGHEKRLEFLAECQRSKLGVHMFGKGFKFVKDKALALLPYSYSIVIENGQYPDYWSEKLADAFLSYAYPIYYGDPKITETFPPNSMLVFDINDPKALETILSEINSDRHLRHRKELLEARTLVLEKLNFFSFLIQEISAHQRTEILAQSQERGVRVRSYPPAVIESWTRAYMRKVRLKFS